MRVKAGDDQRSCFGQACQGCSGDTSEPLHDALPSAYTHSKRTIKGEPARHIFARRCAAHCMPACKHTHTHTHTHTHKQTQAREWTRARTATCGCASMRGKLERQSMWVQVGHALELKFEHWSKVAMEVWPSTAMNASAHAHAHTHTHTTHTHTHTHAARYLLPNSCYYCWCRRRCNRCPSCCDLRAHLHARTHASLHHARLSPRARLHVQDPARMQVRV